MRDREASLRDYRFEHRYGNLVSIEEEGHRVNMAAHLTRRHDYRRTRSPSK